MTQLQAVVPLVRRSAATESPDQEEPGSVSVCCIAVC